MAGVAPRDVALQGGILSNAAGKDGPGAFREDSGRVWCCWGYRPRFFFPFFSWGCVKSTNHLENPVVLVRNRFNTPGLSFDLCKGIAAVPFSVWLKGKPKDNPLILTHTHCRVFG